MRRLRLRLLVVALALLGLVVLAGLEQQALRKEADRRIADGVAGYLALAVPASPYGDYAADRLISTVSRLQGSAYWHAGLQVTLGGTPVFDETEVPGGALVVPLPGPRGIDTVGQVAVWDAALGGGFPGVSWILAAATFLVAGLANTRRAGWLWPMLGIVLLALAIQAMLVETARSGRATAETTLAHVGPMAALLLLSPRFPAEALEALGPTILVAEHPDSVAAGGAGWRVGKDGPLATMQIARGDGRVVELASAPPAIDGRVLSLGLLGGGIVLLLAMLPPITPRRPPRPTARAEGASIPG